MPLDAAALLERARAALRTAEQADGNGGGTIRPFVSQPTPH